jgi:sialidase-1
MNRSLKPPPFNPPRRAFCPAKRTRQAAQAAMVVALLSASAALPCRADEPAACSQSDVFVSGQGGYHTYRIPSLLVTQQHTVLAFCEGRKLGRGDAGDIDLVLRRSTDGGKTWSPLQVIWDDKDNTCGNPCPVVDPSTGRIWLPLTWNLGSDVERTIANRTSRDTRRVYLTWSDDDGATWAKPVDMTSQLKKPEWTWYATGPAVGIQLTRGPHKGRLVIPCDHKQLVDGQSLFYSHAIYSDDHGQTWQIGQRLGDKVNECTLVELADGRLLLNMRAYHGKNRRAVAYSSDGGHSWTEPKLDEALIEPVCQGCIVRYNWPADGTPGRILFSNPASTQRENMTVRVSYDDGQTWPVSRVIHPSSAAYSCLAVLPGGEVGLLYERDGYARISLARFTIAWLEGGK